MDNTTRTLANYVTQLNYSALSADAVHQTKRRLVDAIACAIGGYASPPADIARRVAANVSGTPPARILNTGKTTSMDMAAFTNAVMVRYLDFNDTFISKGSGHPSDMIPAILAVADGHRLSGKDAMLATVIAYEVYTALADQVGLRDKGWDQGFFVVISAAAGVAKLLKLSLEQTADAIAIAATANVPTRQTRAGELAMWKGVATAAAARSAVSAALLAQAGMTGPTAAFEGKDGVWDQVTGKFQLGELGGNGRPFGIERTNLKFFPSEYHSQAPMWIALELRKKVPVSEIEAVNVETYFTAWSEIGSEPEKWHPKTRETADHSLPYLLSLGFIDGGVTLKSFTPERIADPALHALMNRIKISENKAFTAAFPETLSTRIEVVTRGGQRVIEIAQYPKGHAKNPMTDEDVNNKLTMVCDGVMPAVQRDQLRDALWNIDQAANLDPLFQLLVPGKS
jgi:2-methylcitrate dehydratase